MTGRRRSIDLSLRCQILSRHIYGLLNPSQDREGMVPTCACVCSRLCTNTLPHIARRGKIYRIKKAIVYQAPRAFVRTHRRALVLSYAFRFVKELLVTCVIVLSALIVIIIVGKTIHSLVSNYLRDYSST